MDEAVPDVAPRCRVLYQEQIDVVAQWTYVILPPRKFFVRADSGRIGGVAPRLELHTVKSLEGG